MSYKQVKTFNLKRAGTKAGYCLQNTRLGFGIAAKYNRAITAWNAIPEAQKHRTKTVPSGVDVPLYYDYSKNGVRYGHINVRLASGKVWSDGKIYASLSSYIKGHPALKYLGWGESVNDVRVVKYVAPKPHMETVKLWTWNVRNSSVNGRRIGIVKGGQRFETQVLKNGWRKINYKGKAGYVGPAAWR